MRPIYVGVFLLSTASLAFEITLTRVFSLAQWYHFAFMTVSLALLGFGASGSFLAVFPGLTRRDPPRLLAALSGLSAAGVVGGYLISNHVPFNSFAIAWDWRQSLYLAVYYLSLAVPFFFSGLVMGVLFAARPTLTARLYFANLLGSAAGCLAAVAALPLLGGAGTVLLSALLGALAMTAFASGWQVADRRLRIAIRNLPFAICFLLLYLTLFPPSPFEVRLSPYKSLSQHLRYPGARVVFSRWNAFSRVDVVDSPGIRSAPGLTLAYGGDFPRQMGVFTDGGDPSPVTAGNAADLTDFVDQLPVALPHHLRPGATTLIIEPKGGLDVLVALREGADSVVAVDSNPLVVHVVRDVLGDFAGDVYRDPRVTVVAETGRSYVRRTARRFDLIQLALADTRRAVTSGDYSLSENYGYTVEAFADYLAHLRPGGLLAVSRWLQLPPSESLRAWALAVTALERAGVPHPEKRLVAIRSFSTALILVKNGEFAPHEIEAIKAFCTARSFDLIYYPGMIPAEANRYNQLSQPEYHRAFRALLSAPDRRRFYAAYPYDVRPPTDDRPFFFHYFKWSQTPAVLRTFGKLWQPFGGSGYLVLVALLALAVLASAVLILLPLLFRRRAGGRSPRHRARVFAYFALLGLGYLLVEIPLMQRFILFLSHPIYALATVLGGLLFFSGLGGLASARFPLRWTLLALAVAVVLYPLLLPPVFAALLGWPLAGRVLVALAVLAPLGVLMGVPFPRGLARLNTLAPDLIPWAWGINGCASVLAAIGAVMVAIGYGFSAVLVLGALAYGGAWKALDFGDEL